MTAPPLDKHRLQTTKGLLLFCIFLLLFVPAGCEKKQQRKRPLQPAPDFVAEDLDGNRISLSAWQGSPVILRFWETDCKFCKADTPVFTSYYREHQPNGLKMLYISAGGKTLEQVKAFAAEFGLSFPTVYDQDRELLQLYRVRLTPQTIFIDPQQRIIETIYGGVGRAEMDELLGQYL